MVTDINSKHAVVGRAPYMLYMAFCDMRNFTQMLPEDKKQGVDADYDSLHASVQGMTLGVRVVDRVPYSRISLVDEGAPFGFHIDVCFDAHNGNPDETDFHIDVQADLNVMLKMMIKPKLKEALDKMVDGLADAAAGKMPEGFNPKDYGL